MFKHEIEERIAELKSDYIQVQGDLDKLEANGGNVDRAEAHLSRIENELSDLKKELRYK
ncbi:SE1832 family protein [Salimicrobium flavidum]|uniref:Uncharacterized protein n=1 Tax=Salimicrobium flavidum TaxID=570947 RepID=A0A1N7IUU8_9BACI|nr:SE1832 family protein [Salimicrobium flavidum]SIS40796.1 hypothetical protein SAMN05421687_102254 [Salimicrobium flavidum]